MPLIYLYVLNFSLHFLVCSWCLIYFHIIYPTWNELSFGYAQFHLYLIFLFCVVLILISILILFLMNHVILQAMVNYAAIPLWFFAFNTIAVMFSYIVINSVSSFDVSVLIVAIVCISFTRCSILPFSIYFFNCFFPNHIDFFP